MKICEHDIYVGKVIYIDKEALSKLYFDYNADYNQNNCIRR